MHNSKLKFRENILALTTFCKTEVTPSELMDIESRDYAHGLGWVPVDPADVRKVVLEEKLELNDPTVQKPREQLFGTWEMNWVEFNNARDFILNPVSVISPINFLMYPRAEVEGVPRDELDAINFVYRIESKEITT